MKTAEERAKNICISAFCCLCPKRVYTTCIWRHNTEMANPQCHITEYKELINQVYEETVDELKAQREELTRWHDPKEELPEYYKAVEVKYKLSGLIRISTAWLSAGDAGGYLWTIDGTNRIIKNIIGWREIHE